LSKEKIKNLEEMQDKITKENEAIINSIKKDVNGNVLVTLADGDHTLVYDYNAIATAEEMSGQTIFQLIDRTEKNSLDFIAMRHLLAAGLCHERIVKEEPEYSIVEIKKMLVGINPFKVMTAVGLAVGKLITQFLTDTQNTKTLEIQDKK